jgi:hypothetical protein
MVLKVQSCNATPPNLPEYVRLPKAGDVEYHSGLGRSALNSLILPTKDNPHPPVRSVSLKKPHQSRGIRLIDLSSLLDYLRRLGGNQP